MSMRYMRKRGYLRRPYLHQGATIPEITRSIESDDRDPIFAMIAEHQQLIRDLGKAMDRQDEASQSLARNGKWGAQAAFEYEGHNILMYEHTEIDKLVPRVSFPQLNVALHQELDAEIKRHKQVMGPYDQAVNSLFDAIDELGRKIFSTTPTTFEGTLRLISYFRQLLAGGNISIAEHDERVPSLLLAIETTIAFLTGLPAPVEFKMQLEIETELASPVCRG